MKLYLHIIILVLFICMPSFGQPPHIITRYNIEDGISQQTITSITKDRKGYMWFTTWNVFITIEQPKLIRNIRV